MNTTLRSYLTTCAVCLSICMLASSASAQFRRRNGSNPFLPPQATLHYARTRDYHCQHLKLIFNIDAADHSATGDVTQLIVPFHRLTQVVLDAGPNLQIQSCTLNGAPCQFQHAGDKLTLDSPSPLLRGEEVTLEERYKMPNGGHGGGANGVGGFTWIDPDPNDPGRKPGFWTQGETNTNRNWVPCYDYPNDKCTTETITTVPENWTVIGNGAEGPVMHDAAHHTRTFRWTMTQPHSTYLLSLYGGELDVYRTSWEGVPLLYCAPKGNYNVLESTFRETPEMLSFYSGLVGVKYAWPKYAQDVAYDFPGGMENVSATTLGIYALTDARSDRRRVEFLTSHELAHQWFGDLVTCKDWGDIWLNESFATVFQMMYAQHVGGENEWQEVKEQNLQGYLRGAVTMRHALSTKLYSSQGSMFESSHTYDKGGLILAMLRHQLGDGPFFRGLHTYLELNKYTPVDSHDLEKAFAVGTGVDVEPFFDQWVFKPGHPILDMTWSYDAGAHAVHVNVKQLQSTSDGTPIYNTPLTLGLVSNGKVDRRDVQLNSASQEFTLAADASPDAVLLDPDHDLLKEVKDNHWTPQQLPVVLRYAPDYVDRLAAAQQIAAGPGGAKANEQLFAEAARAETNDQVADYLTNQLSGLKDPSLRPLFFQMAHSKDDDIAAAGLHALGSVPADPSDRQYLRQLASSDTAPYSLVEGALEGLAAGGSRSDLEIFKHQLEHSSPGDQLAASVVRALSGVGAGAPLLIEATGPSHGPFVRMEAIRTLTPMEPGNPAIRASLVDLLKDPNSRIQMAALRALESRKERLALPAIQALARRATDPDVKQEAEDASANLSK